MDKEGLLNPQGLWNRRGALLAGLLAGAAIVGFNYVFFEQALGALGLFLIFWTPLLATVLILVVIELAAEWSYPRVKKALGQLPGYVRRLRIPERFWALQQRVVERSSRLRQVLARWAAERGVPQVKKALKPSAGFVQELRVAERFRALEYRLALPLRRWKWRKADWAGVRSISRIDEWRRGRLRETGSRSGHDRRAA